METGELKNNQETSSVDSAELERRKQWDAIAKPSDVDETSMENNQSSIQEQEQDYDKKNLNVEEARRKEQIDERDHLKKSLENRRKELAELYVKNRQLLPGSKNKINFLKAQNDYEVLLNAYLKTDAKITYDDRMKELKRNLQAKLNELNTEDAELEAKKQALDESYFEDCKRIKDEVNQSFLKSFLNQQNELSEETIKQMDEGNTFRKIVHAFRSNKYLKGAIIAAGAIGLTVATAGLASGIAAGTISVGFNLTAGGALAGAARGATAGLIASRQDSKNSAIHSFQNDNIEEIQQLFEELGDVTDKHVNTKGVANWLMSEYNKANATDRQDNRKRTLIATGLGAALGALSSGVEISRIGATTKTIQTGQSADTIKITNFDKVNIAEGHGAYDTFTQMGGDPDKLQQALDIMHNIDSKYGLVPGDNGVVGSFAHTYPGPISSWPDAAQVYMEEVAKEWAKQGLIPSETITGGPVYDTVLQATQTLIPTGFLHYLAGAATGAVVGGARPAMEDTSASSSLASGRENTGEQNRTEVEKNPADVASADNIRREIAERRAKASAARIKAEIAARKENEAKRRSSDANEEVTAAEERVEQSANKEPSEETKASVAHLKAEAAKRKENAETEMRRANEASAAAIKAKAAERAANEALIAAEKSAAEGIRAQMAARRANT